MKKFNFLFSYAYLWDEDVKRSKKTGEDKTYQCRQKQLEDTALELSSYSDVLIDCGAYTAYTRGKEIPIDRYIADCKRYHGKVWQYIQLDKVRNPSVTKTNLDKMLHAGLRPMPVLQIGESFERMPALVKINPWVCCAGGVYTPAQWIHHRYQQAFKASHGKANIHALGFLRYPDVFQLPIKSGDSSAYYNGMKYGWLVMFDRREGMIQIHNTNIKKKGSRGIDPRFIVYMEQCGLKPEDVVSGTYNHGQRSFMTLACVHAYLRFASFCAEKDFKFFFVIIDFMNLMGIMCVNAFNKGNYFDYKQAAAMYDYLQDIRVNDKPKWYDTMNKVIAGGLK